MAMKGSNVVNVTSIDEERLKFRVTIAIQGSGVGLGANPPFGEYPVAMPIPTFFGNSNEYNQCLIKCNGFMAYDPTGIADPVWDCSQAAPGAPRFFQKVGAIEIQLDIPSSQTTTITQGSTYAGAVGGDALGFARIGGYRELMFLDCHSVGDNTGANYVVQGSTAAWSGKSTSDPILCGNPFGQTITIKNKNAILDEACYLVSHATGVGAVDRGNYFYSFDIQMVPNK